MSLCPQLFLTLRRATAQYQYQCYSGDDVGYLFVRLLAGCDIIVLDILFAWMLMCNQPDGHHNLSLCVNICDVCAGDVVQRAGDVVQHDVCAGDVVQHDVCLGCLGPI